MEATGTGLTYSEMHVQRLTPSQQLQLSDCRPNKRKRLSHRDSDPPAATCSPQPRALGMTKSSALPQLLQCSRAGEDISISSVSRATRDHALLEKTALATPTYGDGNLCLSQAYRDSRLHDDASTIIHRSGHQYVPPAMSARDSLPNIGSSFCIGSPSAISLASAQPGTEDNFAPSSSSPSTHSDGVERAYNPIYHHPQQWPASGPSNAINSQRQFVSHPLSQSQSQPVPPSFVAGGGNYHNYGFLLPAQAQDLNPHFVTTLSDNANVVPGQHATILSSHTLDEAQNLAGTRSSNSLLQHGHQETFFTSHQVLPVTELVAATAASSSSSSSSSYQTSAPSLAAVSYTPHIQPDIEVQGPPHLPLHSDPYIPDTMGGGEFHPSHRQVLEDDAFSQAIHTLPDNHYRGIEVTVAMDASTQHVCHSYHQMTGEKPGQGVSDTSTMKLGAAADVSKRPKAQTFKSSSLSLSSTSELRGKEDDGQAPAAKKPRGPMNPNHRRQTAETRKRKACTRCRTQKMRCDIDPFDELGPCVGCKSFCKTSKKTLHLTPCFRGKITDAVLFRSGGLGLTRRWNGTEMKDVGNRINSSDIRTIEFTQGLWRTAIRVRVVAFEPEPTDVTARYWMLRDSDNDVRKKKELATYCLVNVQETADYFERYIRSYAVAAMIEQKTGPVRIAGQRPALLGVIERTYMAAVKHHDDLKSKLAEVPDPDNDRELSLLNDLFTFWFARRHTTGSAYISGEDTLGMKPETKDDTYPLFGKVSLPRMIVAQFDSINHTRLLTRYGKKVLTELEALMMRNQPRWWFIIYVCLFILLREASWLSEDRYRHARQNHGKKMRYSVPSFVENLQEGCNNLLQHWHYYNCKPWPDPAAPWDRHKSLLSELSSEHYDLVMETMTDPSVQKQLDVWRRYKKENGEVEKPAIKPLLEGETEYQGSQTQYDWDHPFYWISQLFEEQWRAHPTYQSE